MELILLAKQAHNLKKTHNSWNQVYVQDINHWKIKYTTCKICTIVLIEKKICSEKQRENLWIKQPVRLPLNLPRTCRDFAFRKTASNSKPTACIDICGSSWFWERLFWCSLFLERASLILGVTAPISIPSKTCKAATKFPFWYSYLPSRALASCELQTYFSLKKNRSHNHEFKTRNTHRKS